MLLTNRYALQPMLYLAGQLLSSLLQDVFGGERKNNVLSFWKADGDSLKFVFFDTKVRLGNIDGSLIVRDVAVVSENKFLVVTEHHVTDHGVGGS